MTRGKSISASVALLLVLPLAAAAQHAATATLRGTVRDPAGAVVPGAQVTLTQRDTNVARHTTTDATGSFAFAELPPGRYEVVVDSEGFGELSTNVDLLVGQTVRRDLTLSLGERAETVTVDDEDNYLLVNTVSAVVDGVVSAYTIRSLPLNGRNYLELSFLVPGNAPAPNFDPTKANSVLVSSAGQFGRGGNVTIDGADDNDDMVGGPLHNVPEDAVQEFQVTTNQFSAALGRSGSSVINVVTKSGGNALHGTGAVYYRNDALQALPATFDRSLGLTPPFDREQYSGAVGGPLKKDKVWWFGAVEYRNQDGVVLVGQRDPATQTIARTFANSPLNDLMFTGRVDAEASPRDWLTFRYSLEREDDIATSTLERAIGSASERQDSNNHFQAGLFTWTRTFTPRVVNRFNFSVNNFRNRIEPVTPGPQLTFPSLQAGASFRVPQQTRQNRLQIADSLTWVRGEHVFSMGGQVQRVDGDFLLQVFQQGRIELVEDFPSFDHNGDGVINDEDLLFAVTLRSAFPDRPLVIPDADNNFFAGFFQDDWRVAPWFSLNLGLRYELDTDVKDVSRVSELNPLILPFLHGTRHRDTNNLAPRVGFNLSTRGGTLSLRGGYGIFYDRIILEMQSLERGLDGRALPVEVRAGNVFFIDPNTGLFLPGAPTLSNPFTGFIIPGAGAGGINIIDNSMQNPMVQHFTLGLEWSFAPDFVLRADGIHDFGTHFIIGRPLGTVFNPVVGGPDVVKNLESSVKTKYDALYVAVEKRFSHRYHFLASYTLSKAFNYANDDQIPFAAGPLDPNNLQLEYGPTPNDQRHRFAFSGFVDLPYGFQLSSIWTLASGVPMDILLPDGSTRIPTLQRNAGGRLFHTAGELNAFITQLNAAGGVNGEPLPLVSNDARFNDSFNSFDLRVSKTFQLGERWQLQALAEAFNLFNVTNVLGVSNVNYSGFSNVLVRDSNNPADPGYLHSSSFGQPVTTAGGVFGSGGPRAFQLAVRVNF